MAASSWRRVRMDRVLRRLQADYADISFEVGESACWSPKDQRVFYKTPFGEKELWALCHEIGHARLGHKSFTSDVDLLKKEVAAWQEAKMVAEDYNVSIDNEHIEDCLDSYRDWLYKRSTCPSCQFKGIQQEPAKYTCLNCQTVWQVTYSRFCRPYRRQVTAN